MEFIALVLVASILSYVAVKVNFSFLRWVAAISWWGMFVYWMQYPPATVTPGEATHIAVMCVFICAGLGMALFGMGKEIQRSKKETLMNGKAEKTSVFSKFKWGFKSPDEPQKSNKSWAKQENESDYRARVRRGLYQSVPNRRRERD